MTWTQVLIAAGAGGVVLFVWNAVCWVALPHHLPDFRPLKTADAVARDLTAAAVTPGMYQVPHFKDFPGGMKDPALDARCRAGPNALIVVAPAGPCMQGKQFVGGFVLNVLEALAAAVVFRYAAASVHGLPRTVALLAGMGALVHGAPHAAQAVWMRFPWSHAVKSALDGTVGFALLGVLFHVLRG